MSNDRYICDYIKINSINENNKNEIFKIIKYNPNYKISNLGRVISIGRYYKNQFGNSNVKTKDRILKQYKTTNGYMQVDLCLDSKYIKIGVHRLVSIAFIENPENKPEINHIDGNKENNNVNNLEWVTTSQNVKHAFDTGLANNKNLSISKRQISCEIVKQIRERCIPRDSKHGTRAMAREFGIAQYTVSQIIRGLTRTKYETA